MGRSKKLSRNNSASLVCVDMIDVAVLERAAGEGELFGAAIKHDGAFHEGAAIKAGKMNLAAEIKYLGVKGIIPEYAFFVDIGHCFAF